jgi:hypothetical protein
MLNDNYDGSGFRTIYRPTPILSPPRQESKAKSPGGTPTRNNTAPKGGYNLTAKERLRQRLKGRQSNVNPTASGARFSSANVRSRLEQVAPLTTPEAKMKRRPRNNQSNSSSHVDVSSGEQSSDEMHGGIPKHASTGAAAHVEDQIPPAQGETLLNVPTNQWQVPDFTGATPRAGTGIGPKSFGQPSPVDENAFAEMRRLEQERETSQQFEEAIKLAYELQRAAEDELSFHGSINSRDQHMGYGYDEGDCI